ncbi:hypothetical protein H0H93_008750 [Arthromyces matolae]|nr:hypothetical protein H0H93_008750 [Arthromyces matolae]
MDADKFDNDANLKRNLGEARAGQEHRPHRRNKKATTAEEVEHNNSDNADFEDEEAETEHDDVETFLPYTVYGRIRS